MTNPNRNRLYKLLRVGKSELQWDEDFYRQMLKEHGAKEQEGKYSASTMSIAQMEVLLSHMKRCGFKVKRSPQRISADVAKRKAAQKAKLTAIWLCLFDNGVVRNRSEASMEKFVARFTDNKPLRWATEKQMSDAIEALKKMAERAHVDLKSIEREQRKAKYQEPAN